MSQEIAVLGRSGPDDASSPDHPATAEVDITPLGRSTRDGDRRGIRDRSWDDAAPTGRPPKRTAATARLACLLTIATVLAWAAPGPWGDLWPALTRGPVADRNGPAEEGDDWTTDGIRTGEGGRAQVIWPRPTAAAPGELDGTARRWQSPVTMTGLRLRTDVVPADRPTTAPDRLPVDVVLVTFPMSGLDGAPTLTGVQLPGLGALIPDAGVLGRTLPTRGRLVLPATLIPDCAGWWNGSAAIVLTVRTPTAGESTAVGLLPGQRTADLLRPLCPAPRRGLALAVTQARAVGPGAVVVRVVNHGSRPLEVQAGLGGLFGTVRVDGQPRLPLPLAPGSAALVRLRVSLVDPGTCPPQATAGPGRRVGTATWDSPGQAITLQGRDPGDPSAAVVAADDATEAGRTLTRALTTAAVGCSPSTASRS